MQFGVFGFMSARLKVLAYADSGTGACFQKARVLVFRPSVRATAVLMGVTSGSFLSA